MNMNFIERNPINFSNFSPTFQPSLGRPRRALLINPPIYDTQYYAEWSLPHGLLKIASYLKNLGYETKIIDCLFTNETRRVKKTAKAIARLCSSEELDLGRYRHQGGRLLPGQRLKFVFGKTLPELREELLRLAQGAFTDEYLEGDNAFVPDEVYIASVMTYWWESTVDTARVVKSVFPDALLRFGGIYPTLVPQHLEQKLRDSDIDVKIVPGGEFEPGTQKAQQNIIVAGEVPAASWLDLDFEIYQKQKAYYRGPAPGRKDYLDQLDNPRNYGPTYSILMSSRGCPFNCHYCAQKAYNGGITKMRGRGVDPTIQELKHKYNRYGIREFAFYEDNFLAQKKQLEHILRTIGDDPELKGLTLTAPEGVEVRLAERDVVKTMRKAGFKKVYLPLENIYQEVNRGWNRNHTGIERFERALENCKNAGFEVRNRGINAFILFGTPGEDIRNVVDTVVWASNKVGSIIPMLFTPVPGSEMFNEYKAVYEEKGFDLQHLNGKLLPFLEYNQRFIKDKYRGRYEVKAEDYIDLEAFMFRTNAQARNGTFDLGSESKVATAFRQTVVGYSKEPVRTAEGSALGN